MNIRTIKKCQLIEVTLLCFLYSFVRALSLWSEIFNLNANWKFSIKSFRRCGGRFRYLPEKIYSSLSMNIFSLWRRQGAAPIPSVLFDFYCLSITTLLVYRIHRTESWCCFCLQWAKNKPSEMVLTRRKCIGTERHLTKKNSQAFLMFMLKELMINWQKFQIGFGVHLSKTLKAQFEVSRAIMMFQHFTRNQNREYKNLKLSDCSKNIGRLVYKYCWS